MRAIGTVALTLALAALSLCAGAQDLDAIKVRMQGRVAKLADLKTQKLVGEDRAGTLQVLKPEAVAPADAKMIAEENADRRQVYAAIAASTGASPEQVGRSRAEAIHRQAAPGIMLQAADGTWTEKR